MYNQYPGNNKVVYIWKRSSIFMIMAMGALFAIMPAQADEPHCMRMKVGSPDSTDIQNFCRNAKGEWVSQSDQPQAQQTASSLPEDFHGTIAYAGTYDLSVTTEQRTHGNSLNNLLSSALNSNSKTYQGTVKINLQINGQKVTGNYSGSGTFEAGALTGTRDGDVCRLADRNSTWTVNCRADHFDGTMATLDNVKPRVTGSIDAAATEVTDIGAKEKAAAAKLAAMPPAGPALTKKLEEIVATDSKGWMSNMFDAGSMHNVRIAEGSANADAMTLRGEYTYNGGSSGWVSAKMTGGKLDCLLFWDSHTCRPLLTPEQGQQKREAILGLFQGAANSDAQPVNRPSQDLRDSWETQRFLTYRQNNNMP